MADIRHLITIDTPAEIVYNALTTVEGIRGWWTPDTSIRPVAGSIAEFNFGDRYHNEMRIIELIPDKHVAWKCLVGDPEWIGTEITFDLAEKNGQTTLRFGHNAWKEQTDFFAICNFHWGQYMNSIRDYCETGKGEPYSL